MKALFQYQFVDNGSGLSFSWITKNPMAEGSRQDFMRDMLRHVFVEERIRGSRECIDLAKAITKLPDTKLPQLFGRGSDCEVVGMSAFDTEEPLVKVQTRFRNMFAHSLREFLLSLPYDSDIFDPNVNAVDATNSEKVGKSNQILVEAYRRVKGPEFADKDARYDDVRSGFIQCRYTGQCWPFRTRRIHIFNIVFTRRVQNSRDQFQVWIEQDRVAKERMAGNPLKFEESTVTKLKNAGLYQSSDRSVLERYYKIPAGA